MSQSASHTPYRTLFIFVACAVASLAGCRSISPTPDFGSAQPQDRFLAIRQAKSTNDRTAVPDLVRQLGSDDPLVRVAAIDALESISGHSLGFDAIAPPVERRRAIGRWMLWIDAGLDTEPPDSGREGESDE